MKCSKTLAAAVFIVVAVCSTMQAQNSAVFVQRSGTKLTLAGAPYRYSGPNIEWLGLEGYGPHDPQGPHYPSHFEVDDAFATAAEMGARVVRSQTMGDTVGCPLCVEPTEGKFNDAAFAVLALRSGLKLPSKVDGSGTVWTVLPPITYRRHSIL
jgi:mannan endo-1,4-beta-mannosidase